MGIKRWLVKNTSSLVGKTVAVTGTTGGIGRELCIYLAELGADLIFLDRSATRSEARKSEILSLYPDTKITLFPLDLEDVDSVKRATEMLMGAKIDFLIHNAGAYSIPRHKCKNGLDNVFQINFVSPYYITRALLPTLEKRGGRVVIVGSIAHDYSKIDPTDLDFSTRGRASLVYGNAKRHLTYALPELFSGKTDATLAITHPGITFTNITAHYPKVIFAIIKYPMKIIFMRPKKAALSVLRGLFEPTVGCEWIGPRAFNVWGYPKRKPLTTADKEERAEIFNRAEKIYKDMEDLLS